MNTRRVYLYFALTFLLGILAGGAATFFLGPRLLGPPSGAARRDRIIRRMTRQLNLNEDQARQIRAIMEQTSNKFEDLRKQHQPQFDAIRAESRDLIRKVLTPEQASKFDEMVRKFDERHRRRQSSEPPPPPPPGD